MSTAEPPQPMRTPEQSGNRPRFTRAQVFGALRRVFGFDAFRPLQEDVVRAMLYGADVMVVMPTGGGKSLCYQLPALLTEGLTIVVSPLIALMKDQVDALRANGVAATFINSTLTGAEVWERQRAVREGRVKLLYVAPERLVMPSFLQLVRELSLARLVVDEAHCISAWGHDFRPEYREIGRLRALRPEIPIAAFTATATPRVREDIVTQLGLRAPQIFVGSFNRENLFYAVRAKDRNATPLFELLERHRGKSGIVYCQSRSATETLAERLSDRGYRAVAYHAGLTADERTQRQDHFKRDGVDIVVATIAFGMGIDKPDVRFVVHYDLPKNLEGYYQETGRAGRDGLPSECLLLYSYADVPKLERFLDDIESPEQQRIARNQLRGMVDYAQTLSCRRKWLLQYFGEDYAVESCGACDNCVERRVVVDVTVPAQQLLSCIVRTGERFGATYVVNVLRGSREARLLSFGHDSLPTYGIGKERSTKEWLNLVQQLLGLGLIRRDEEFGALKLTPAGRQALAERSSIEVAVVESSQAARSSPAVEYDDALFQRLRTLRREIADEQGVPAYIVFPDATLAELAARRPSDDAALRTIRGIGETKAQAYGARFLAAIRDFEAEPESG